MMTNLCWIHRNDEGMYGMCQSPGTQMRGSGEYIDVSACEFFKPREGEYDKCRFSHQGPREWFGMRVCVCKAALEDAEIEMKLDNI